MTKAQSKITLTRVDDGVDELTERIDETAESLQTQIKQESDNINRTITDKNTALEKNLTDQLNNYKAEVGQYLSFGDDGLSLGASGSDFKTVLDNQRLSFKDGDTTVAYASNKQFYMPEAVIEKALKIGKYKFVPHNNNDGGMSIIWEE